MTILFRCTVEDFGASRDRPPLAVKETCLGAKETYYYWHTGVDVGVHAPEDLVNERKSHMHAACQKFSKVRNSPKSEFLQSQNFSKVRNSPKSEILQSQKFSKVSALVLSTANFIPINFFACTSRRTLIFSSPDE